MVHVLKVSVPEPLRGQIVDLQRLVLNLGGLLPFGVLRGHPTVVVVSPLALVLTGLKVCLRVDDLLREMLCDPVWVVLAVTRRVKLPERRLLATRQSAGRVARVVLAGFRQSARARRTCHGGRLPPTCLIT